MNADSEKYYLTKFAITAGVFTTLVLIIVFIVRNNFTPSYTRPAEIIDLGEIRYLLGRETYLRDQSVLVFFDEQKGWAVMSARSTINGCDLTYLDKFMFCPCSRVYWDHSGRPVSGQKAGNLPFFQLYYEKYDDGQGMKVEKKMHLLVNTAKIVPPFQYLGPEGVLAAVPKIKEINELQQVNSAAKIPEVLKGKPDGSLGPMSPGGEYIRDYGKDARDLGK